MKYPARGVPHSIDVNNCIPVHKGALDKVNYANQRIPCPIFSMTVCNFTKGGVRQGSVLSQGDSPLIRMD